MRRRGQLVDSTLKYVLAFMVIAVLLLIIATAAENVWAWVQEIL